MSTFITVDDYKAEIKATNLDNMIEQDSTILDNAEASAVSMVTHYLSARYDVDTIFAQVGSARDPHLLRLCKNIVLYILHERLPKRIKPEHISQNYQDTIDFLTGVSDAKIDLVTLPRKTDSETSEPITKFRYGSDTPRSFL